MLRNVNSNLDICYRYLFTRSEYYCDLILFADTIVYNHRITKHNEEIYRLVLRYAKCAYTGLSITIQNNHLVN